MKPTTNNNKAPISIKPLQNMKFKSKKTPKKLLCESCFLYFNTREDLNAHTYFHQNPAKYICYLCQKSFNHKQGLGRHYQTTHPEILNKRISARKYRKWLRSYLRTQITEDDLSLGEIDDCNLPYIESLKSFLKTRLKQEAEWISREFTSEDRLLVEEYYESY